MISTSQSLALYQATTTGGILLRATFDGTSVVVDHRAARRRGRLVARRPADPAADGSAVWQYSPLSVTEGWLRLAPALLRFRVANSAGTPTVTAGTTMALVLTITNARTAPITFEPATIVGETAPKQGTLIYLHFSVLVAPADLAAIEPSADGWTFEALTDPTYGTYWAAAPASTPVTLAAGAAFSIALANVAIAAISQAQAQVYFDYYNVTGDSDGTDVAMLTVT